METIKNKFKKSLAYYWIMLIIMPAFKDAFTASETRGRILDILITLIVAAIAIQFFKFNIDIGANSITLILLLVTAIFLRFISNLIYLPAKLHFDTFRKQDRFAWENIEVNKKEWKDNGILRGYGVRIKNNKPFTYRVLVQMPYYEIDGVSDQEEVSNSQNIQKARKLAWAESPNPSMPYEGWIEADNGDASFYLFDVIPNSHSYLIRYWELPSDSPHTMLEKTVSVKNSIRGNLIVILDMIDYGRTGHEYFFEIIIDRYGNSKMRVAEGRLKSYKPPLIK